MSITEKDTTRYLQMIAGLTTDEGMIEMETFAQRQIIPIIHKEASAVLKYFIETERPKRILELGTAMAYSSILMANRDSEIQVDTIERDPNMIKLARANIRAFDLAERIQLMEGEIDQILKELTGPYDFFFIDAGKSHYREYLDRCLEIANPSAMFFCDNILVRGLIAKEGIVRKQSTIIMNMRKFIEEVTLDKRFHSMVLPVGDGLMIIKCKE